MTVKEQIKELKNNGTIKVFNDKTKRFVNVQDESKINDVEVKDVKYSRGYGFKQINATIHVFA